MAEPDEGAISEVGKPLRNMRCPQRELAEIVCRRRLPVHSLVLPEVARIGLPAGTNHWVFELRLATTNRVHSGGPLKSHYRLYELEDTEFEDLACRICMQILGLGTISFSAGKDGGRDGRFNGTATKFPSSTSPATGKFVVQSKHTTVPGASCSDSVFQRLFKEEVPKITALASEGELEYYLLFTNRSLAGGMEKTLIKQLNRIKGVKDAWILADDPIRQHLDSFPDVWKSMGFPQALTFRFAPDDINEVVRAFYASVTTGSRQFESALDFGFVGKDKKNAVNGLTKPYYEYMKRDSLPSFGRIRDFLQDERNSELRSLYHDAADELKQKIITFRSDFNNFDEVLTHVFDLIVSSNVTLRGKKRLVRTFLHYMYFDCDIGEHAETS